MSELVYFLKQVYLFYLLLEVVMLSVCYAVIFCLLLGMSEMLIWLFFELSLLNV